MKKLVLLFFSIAFSLYLPVQMNFTERMPEILKRLGGQEGYYLGGRMKHMTVERQ